MLHRVGLVHQTLHRFAVDPHLIVIGDECKLGLFDLSAVTDEDQNVSDSFNYVSTPRRQSVDTTHMKNLRKYSIFSDSPVSPRPTGGSRRSSIISVYSETSTSSPRTPRRRSSVSFSPTKTYSKDYVFSCPNERIFRDVTGGDNSKMVNNVWTLGTIFAFLLRGIPIFKGSTSTDVWENIVKIFGKPNDDDWSDRQSNIKTHIENIIQEKGFKVLDPLAAEYVFGSCTDEELELLKGMLCINHEKRMTTDDILHHPYFSDFHHLIPEGELLNTFEQRMHQANECTLVVAGSNLNYQTGMSGCNLHPTLGFLNEENSVFEKTPVVKKVCTTSDTTMLLTNEGKVIILGGSKDSCFVEFELENIVDIDCNGTENELHYLMVRDDGTLFVYGSNNHGQLGLGNTKENGDINAVSIEGEKVIKAAAGLQHTIVMTNNAIYSCGANKKKQCGLEDFREYVSSISKIGTFNSETLKDVKCGDNHTIVLLECGRVFTFGDNKYGQ